MIEGRALGRVPVLVPVAQVQPDEGPITVTPVAPVDLLRVMVKLMSVALVNRQSHRPLLPTAQADEYLTEG